MTESKNLRRDLSTWFPARKLSLKASQMSNRRSFQNWTVDQKKWNWPRQPCCVLPKLKNTPIRCSFNYKRFRMWYWNFLFQFFLKTRFSVFWAQVSCNRVTQAFFLFGASSRTKREQVISGWKSAVASASRADYALQSVKVCVGLGSSRECSGVWLIYNTYKKVRILMDNVIVVDSVA